MPDFKPLVTAATTAQSPDVQSIISGQRQGRYYIPDYQRDSSQWTIPKRSLFVESLINGLTIPPLIVYPEDDPQKGFEVKHIVDGQQRLTTINEYIDGKFSLAAEADVEYAPNVGPIIQGKRFDELPQAVREQILNYTVNIIVLPKNLSLELRLNIFRRINEGGLPLSPHDLRLAQFGNAGRVYFIRIVGVFDVDREGSQRMLTAGRNKYALNYPWKDVAGWKDWWLDSRRSLGQAPSEMFLDYIIARDLGGVDQLLGSEQAQAALGIRHDGSTTSVLDLYCAQSQRETSDAAAPKLLADLDKLQSWFSGFETWFNVLKTEKVPRMLVNSATKIAFFLAAAGEIWSSPDKLSEKQWELVQWFITQGPGKIREKIGIEYPITKGKWTTQRRQIEATVAICKAIANTK